MSLKSFTLWSFCLLTLAGLIAMFAAAFCPAVDWMTPPRVFGLFFWTASVGVAWTMTAIEWR